MKDEQRFEIERALDLLPHVVGASWAVMWFRLSGIKRPTREEFRNKVIEYFNLLKPLFESLPQSEEFSEIEKYIQRRQNEERDRIKEGQNREIEIRYDRYVDYG